MAAPNMCFLFNHSNNDTVYSGTGESEGDWLLINPITDTIVFTGGGILGGLSTPTCASGTRDATIRPTLTSYIIPQVYIESDIMYNVPLAGKNQNRYVFCIYVSGTINSDVYLEAFDDSSFSTTSLPILTGSSNNGMMSCINAICTTAVAPPSNWNGSSTNAAYLRSWTNRIPLANESISTNKAVYYNMYIQLETDTPTFHNTPVIAFRYLYS